ncbi:MAG: integrase [Pirellula sp.]|nr:integrase [Pirellula sp.]
MASISSDKNGNRTIQFVAGDRKRRSIRLGKLPKKSAETIKSKIEALNAAAIAQTSWDAETAAWVGKLESLLYDKLATAGLVPLRNAGKRITLAPFIDDYVASRSDVKPGTALVYAQTKAALVGYFGQSKAIGDITAADGDDWRRWMATKGKRADGSVRKPLGPNTIRKRCSVARQFFRSAVRRRLLEANPFGDMKGLGIKANRDRQHFVTREDAAKVIEACPNAQWRLLFALSRFGGLRCPSEHLALKWADIDWATNRFTVRSPKTEHHEDKAERIVPIFPELKRYLIDAFDPEAVYVITQYRVANSNLRTELQRIIERAEVRLWPKLFQNLRASRATELAAEYPAHVAAEWLGHSTLIAEKHYWQSTEADFDKASSPQSDALQNPVQSSAVSPSKGQDPVTTSVGFSEETQLSSDSDDGVVVRLGFEPRTKGL